MIKLNKLIAMLVFAGVGMQLNAMQQEVSGARSGIQKVNDPRLVQAVRARDAQEVRRLLEHNVDPNSTNEIEVPALRYAAQQDDPTITKLLIAFGADVNKAKVGFISSLGEAAVTSANPEIIRLLIEHGAHFQTEIAPGVPVHVLHLLYQNGRVDALRAALTAIPLEFHEHTQSEWRDSVIAGELAVKKTTGFNDRRKIISGHIIRSMADGYVQQYVRRLLSIKFHGETLLELARKDNKKDIVELIDLDNPVSYAKLRNEIERNIRRIMFAPKAVVNVEQPTEERTVELEDPVGSFDGN